MRLFKSGYKNETDERLMIMIAKGDACAFEILYDRYSGPLMGYFKKMLWQDTEKAEDFMQDIFTKIIHKPYLFDPDKKFKTWIYSIANNMCKNEYRKQEVRKGTKNNLDDQLNIQGTIVKTDEVIDRGDFSTELDKALTELDEKHRSVFIMRFKMDLSIKEIAEVLDISDGTVKSRVFYCLKKLNTRLAEFDPAKKEEIYG